MNESEEKKQQIIELGGMDEPYWCGPEGRGEGLGYTTPELIELRKLIQEVVQIPIQYNMGSLKFWEDASKNPNRLYYNNTWISDEAYDYIGIYYYPFRYDENWTPIYERDKAISRLDEEYNFRESKNLTIKLIWMTQTFEYKSYPARLRMPTSEEMLDLGTLVFNSNKVDMFTWYPWEHHLYDSTLKDHSELWDTVKELSQFQFQNDTNNSQPSTHDYEPITIVKYLFIFSIFTIITLVAIKLNKHKNRKQKKGIYHTY